MMGERGLSANSPRDRDSIRKGRQYIVPLRAALALRGLHVAMLQLGD
jgi:hypothetical protein